MLSEFLRKKTGTIYVKTKQKNKFKKGKITKFFRKKTGKN